MPATSEHSKASQPAAQPLAIIRVPRGVLTERLSRWLKREHHPRLQMSMLLLITTGLAFLASNLLLRAGMDHMGRRYLLTSVIAYLVYLGLLWLWMRALALRKDWLSDGSDVAELATELPLRLGRPAGSSDLLDPVAEAAGAADEGFLPLLVASAILLILCASAWVVYAAPTLFAELLIDGVMVSALCHRLSTEDRRNWLATALQHTLAPFLLTMLVVWLGGTALADWFPKAHTIGDVLFR